MFSVMNRTEPSPSTRWAPPVWWLDNVLVYLVDDERSIN